MLILCTWFSIAFFMRKSVDTWVCTDRLLPGVSDDQFTASSQNGEKYLPSNARLDSTLGHNWCPSREDISTSYIQVKMNTVETVDGVITQGRHDKTTWVTGYYVQYSLDGNTWKYVQDEAGVNKRFLGNSDMNTWVTQTFDAKIRLQYLRIYPQEYNYHPCLRFDVIGCHATTFTTFAMKLFQITTENVQSQYTSQAAEGHTSTTVETFEQSSKPPPSTSANFSLSTTLEPRQITPQNNNVQCNIVCPKNYTKQELMDIINQLKQELRTEKTKTSTYIRSKTSASDERKSSAAIGYLGIIFLCVIGTGVILLDLKYLLQFLEDI